MAETKYTYDVTNDFPGGKVNIGVFQTEITGSSILTALERIDTAGGALSLGVLTGGSIDIVFKDALSTGDKTKLDNDTTGPAGGLIAAHDNSPTQSEQIVQLKDVTVSSKGRIQTEENKPGGSEDVYISHDLCDPTSWYQESARATGVFDFGATPTSEIDLGVTNVIDMWSDRNQQEHRIRASGDYDCEVYVNGATTSLLRRPRYADSGGDFSLDAAAGTISLFSPVTGQVEVRYNQAQSSGWTIQAEPGTTLEITDAEVQFSEDLEYKSTVLFTIEIPHPVLPGEFLEIDRTEYPTKLSIVREAYGTFPEINKGTATGLRDLPVNLRNYPFKYTRRHDIESTMGVRMRISLEGDVPFGGYTASVTFHVAVDPS